MRDFWLDHRTLVQFTLVDVLFAVSTFIGVWGGVLSLAPVAFGALGGYTTAWLQTEFPDLHVIGVLLVVVAVSIAVGIVLAAVLSRVAGIYFALATLALVLIGRVVIINTKSVTGGTTGHAVANMVNLWQLAIAVVVALAMLAIMRGSRLGLALGAVRSDPNAAASLGVSLRRVRMAGFVLSGIVGAIAGFFLACFLQYIDPHTFYIDLAFIAVAAVILGGDEHWLGPLVGATVLAMLPDLLETWIGDARDLVNGALLIVIMIYMPRGIVPTVQSRLRKPAVEPNPA